MRGAGHMTAHKPRKPPPPREAEVQKKLLQWLRLNGICCWRFNGGALIAGEGSTRRYVRFNTARGCSDLLGILPSLGGKFLAVEVKRPGGVLTDLQSEFLAVVRAAGGIALCCSSIEELEEALKAEGWTP